ncbi:DNA-binding transcriptional activator of the SARP family [Actinokineospora alba]|uniref:DNA-binding transcriptional activator of the SARP family n=1 Tax=Actinokineospora alba TaxID=504798 RepID=A0A1H0G703_9PSEU|nr:BTAD domain-containing putative transcriptional regulator [Actinokineospora alba]TDP69789.1 DNA-binding SARP family transcriptional activator [Actinokineospora alba]SDI08655.1 DNA-binding transcriptional activator of the SARP family [Actinokineospora alba]SDO02677.1 DNA-binding transcriptional activator of the SARP family [Actinokineospora alba]
MEFRLLGPFEVRVGERKVLIPRRRERALLAVLALEPGKAVSADRLTDLLWEADPPAASAAALRTHVSRLRTALPAELAVIERQGAGYALLVDPERVDAHRFRTLLAAGADADDATTRADLLHAALRLWRGPALGDLGPELGERLCRGLRESRLDALDLRVEADLALGRHRAVIPELHALITEAPERERFTAHLMLALHRDGRRTEALAAYADRRQVLADEFGLDPGPELRARHEQVLRDDPALALVLPQEPKGPNTLPYGVADFTGRDAEIAELLDRVAAGNAAISAIDGMAGVGKTALALHVAHQVTAEFPDGQLFLDLHAHSGNQGPVEPGAALERLLHTVGVPADAVPARLEERAALWRSRLAGRRMVIVLDNAASADHVRPMLPGAPGCLVLVTSRRRLTGLAGAAPLSLEPLPADEAAALVRRMVGRAEAEPAPVAELVGLCGHLPLAIRVASARLLHRPSWTVGHLVDRLRGERDRLAELAAEDRGVAAAFALSHHQLDTDQRRMFRLLGTHVGADIDVYAAAALVDLPVEKAELLLESLLDVHLLTQRTHGRYAWHDLLREYAAWVAHAEETPECLDHAAGRLLDFYLFTSELANQVLMPSREPGPSPLTTTPADHPDFEGHPAATKWFNAERANLVAAVLAAPALGRAAYAWAITRNMAMYLISGGHLDAHLATHTVAIDQARLAGDTGAEAIALLNLATGCWMSDRYRLAIDPLTRALELTRAAGDRFRETVALNRLSVLHHSLGDSAKAMDLAREALAIAQESGNPREEIFAEWTLSGLHCEQGNPAEALAGGERVQQIAGRVGESMWEIAGRIRRANATAHLGGDPWPIFTEAVEIGRRIGDPMHVAEALVAQAECHLLRTDPHAALAAATEAIDLISQGSRPSVTSAAHGALASAHLALGNLATAREHAELALAAAAGVGHVRLREKAESTLVALENHP